MNYPLSRSSSPSPDYAYPIIPSSSEKEKDEAISEKEKDKAISEKEFLIPGLNDDVAYMILRIAARGGMDIRTVCCMLKVSRAWRHAVDTIILEPCWNRLEKKTQEANTGVSLRHHRIFIKLAEEERIVKTFAEGVANSALRLSSAEDDLSEEGSLPNAAQSIELSYFSRFSDLTNDLRNSGVPIPREQVVLGFDYLVYEEKQRELNAALEAALRTIWPQIKSKIDFKGAPIPANAEAIRAWLNDPINADQIARVTNLNLWQTSLTVLPSEIGNLSGLEVLIVHKGLLTTLPPEIRNLHQLKQLNLNTNRLTTLPSEIGYLSRLEKFVLSENHLTTLPPEIGNLRQLREFFLMKNRLTGLPPEIGNLRQLREFFLMKNRLTGLPPEIGNLDQLREFVLTENALTTLPAQIGNLSELEKLFLAENDLTTLPPEIGKLSKLKQLLLSENRLTRLPPEIGNLSELTWLDLSDNHLTTLPPEIAKLSKLTSLFLDGNLLIFNLDEDFTEVRFSDCRSLMTKYLGCSSFMCNTPLASLCQQIHLGQEDDLLRNTFETLSDEMQQRILEAWRAIPSSASSSSEAGEDLFADRASFVRAVITALQGKWESLSKEQRNQTYAQVAILAGQPEKDLYWGMLHTRENIIRLIEAMELVTQK